MSTVWKQAIKDFLRTKNEKDLRTHLRKEWIDIYPEQKEEIYNFLYLARQHKLFLYLFAVDLQSHILDIPWIQALSILTHSRVSVSSDLFDEMVDNFKKQKFVSRHPTSMTDLITELKVKDRQRFMQKMLRTKQELMASARIAQSERLMEQHVQYMNELKKIFPNEFNVASLITDQEKKKAGQILAKNSKNRRIHKINETPPVSQDEQALLKVLSKQAEDYLKANKAKPSDLAFLFRSMGENQKAIEFIYQNSDEEKKDWQLLDYLFSGEQYVSLLDHCQILKKKYAQYPDALFSISYAESVAYWELGEKDVALELMKQIASMRPDFKSASEILAQWQEESFE